MTRATIYLDDKLHKALKMKAVEVSTSISELVNDAVKATFLEDLEDLEAFEKRKKEKPISYEYFLKELKKSGAI